MYKSVTSGLKKYALDTRLHNLHKEGFEQSDFGMNNTSDLVGDGFGLYSTVNTKKNIGPVKTEYFRIALTLAGTATFTIGLETFHPVRNTIIFGFPGQVFSLRDPSDDFFTYYMLFTESFIAESLLQKNYRNRFRFLTYAGIQCFPLGEDEAKEIEAIIMKMNEEVKARKENNIDAIRLYIQLIFIIADRNYSISNAKLVPEDTGGKLFTDFLKLVSKHFLTLQKVGDYAKMLHVSADHLNRTIKLHSDKTAHELIHEMIKREAQAYLLHSALSVSEIGYQLGFSDPSHFNKFFRKLEGCTPLQYRNKHPDNVI